MINVCGVKIKENYHWNPVTHNDGDNDNTKLTVRIPGRRELRPVDQTLHPPHVPVFDCFVDRVDLGLRIRRACCTLLVGFRFVLCTYKN